MLGKSNKKHFKFTIISVLLFVIILLMDHRYGGTFIFTTEFLSRFNNLSLCIAVDVIDQKNLLSYIRQQPNYYQYVKTNSHFESFRNWISQLIFYLVFIDGDHSYEGVKSDFLLIKDHSRIIAFHDISSDSVPGVREFWNEVKLNYSHEYEVHEFTQQYSEIENEFMGIGVLVKKRQ